MRRTTEDRTRGIGWTLLRALEDLDLADNLALVSHTHQHIQEETSRLNTYAQQIGLNISQKKTGDDIEHPKLPPVQVNGEDLPRTERFTYSGQNC